MSMRSYALMNRSAVQIMTRYSTQKANGLPDRMDSTTWSLRRDSSVN